MDTIKFYFYYLKSEFLGEPIIIQLTVFLVMILLLLYLFSIARIFFIAHHQRKKKKRYEQIRARYEFKVRELLQNPANIMAYQIRSEFAMEDKGLKPWEKIHITNLLLDLINDTNEIEYP